jgi:hypothetical protein
MVFNAVFEIETQCVAISNHDQKIRHETSDESVGATAPQLLKPSNSYLLCLELDQYMNKSEVFRLIQRT